MTENSESTPPSTPPDRAVGNYVISADPARLDTLAIHGYLRRSYWSEGIPFEIVDRAVNASLCIGAYDQDGQQVGLVRLISDFATFCFVCDVYVLEPHRGRGLSKAMMTMAMQHPKLQELRRWLLGTLDAHGLYRQFGFSALAHPERVMEIIVPDIYKRALRKR
jgi:GNAT superfamily N-acetyltransferase